MTEPKIVYATDFSDPSQFALSHAVAQAAASHAKLLIVHVQEMDSGGEAKIYTTLDEPHIQKKLRKVVPRRFAGAYEHHLLVGDPAEELTRFSTEQNADLIVLGTHGRTGFRRVLMGSVAEQVVRTATCPVLVVRQPREQ